MKKSEEQRATFDPKRTADGVEITKVLEELSTLCPSQRVGQSIENAISAARKTAPGFPEADFFMLENADLLSALVRYRDALRE